MHINAELLTEHQLEFLSSKGGCTGWSESTLIKMPHFGNPMLRLINDIVFGCSTVGKLLAFWAQEFFISAQISLVFFFIAF